MINLWLLPQVSNDFLRWTRRNPPWTPSAQARVTWPGPGAHHLRHLRQRWRRRPWGRAMGWWLEVPMGFSGHLQQYISGVVNGLYGIFSWEIFSWSWWYIDVVNGFMGYFFGRYFLMIYLDGFSWWDTMRCHVGPQTRAMFVCNIL